MINNNLFFKPTTTYREFVILDLIEKDPNITQRDISKHIKVSVALINSYLDNLESKGYLKREYHSTKKVEYFITSKGIERRKYLNIGYLESAQSIYTSARENIIDFLEDLTIKGFKKILLYGAGEVAEIILQSIISDKDNPIKILGIIDDDIDKQNHSLLDTKIISIDEMKNINHDGILISSYTNNELILSKLKQFNYDNNRIIQFFN